MLINKLTDSVKLENSALTFGNFDGLHLGHQQILNKLIEISELHKIPSVVLSFNPHTNCILKYKDFKVLIPFKDKINSLKDFNINHICEIEFNKEFSKLTADKFLDILIQKYNPSYLIFGYDNYFGYNKTGSYKYVKNCKKYKNINCIQVNQYENSEELVKTSNIKKLILDSKIDIANQYLYTKYKLFGYVDEGYKIGRTLGFPTANINVNIEQIIPGNGVYSVNLLVGNNIYKGICNIGVCPTLHNKKKRSIEVHIIDKSINLYNCKVIVEFIKYIRSEQKFNSKEDLINQIKEDILSLKEERIIESE